jgi:hypothetical protein
MAPYRPRNVPDRLDGRERWSLDHLFIDQGAIPTLVEVKRATDTRIRREVVGQLLDYAANGNAYWSIGVMRQAFVSTCARSNEDERQKLQTFLITTDDEFDEKSEAFWNLANDNLASGKIRLLFIADTIPAELLRIIEFLNEQMTNTEVLGVEIRQFSGTSMTAFVPRVVGNTMAAEDKKRKPIASTNSGDAIPRLISAGIIPDGSEMRFQPTMRRESTAAFLAEQPDSCVAVWRNDVNRPLVWNVDKESYSCTG